MCLFCERGNSVNVKEVFKEFLEKEYQKDYFKVSSEILFIQERIPSGNLRKDETIDGLMSFFDEMVSKFGIMKSCLSAFLVLKSVKIFQDNFLSSENWEEEMQEFSESEELWMPILSIEMSCEEDPCQN